MDKKKHQIIEVTELGLEPIGDEDLPHVRAAQESTNMRCGGDSDPGGGGDDDGGGWCTWYCPWYPAEE